MYLVYHLRLFEDFAYSVTKCPERPLIFWFMDRCRGSQMSDSAKQRPLGTTNSGGNHKLSHWTKIPLLLPHPSVTLILL